MHILISLLSFLALLFLVINRARNAGIDLNPFPFIRRFKWDKQHNQKVIYTLSSPVELAGVLVVGIAKCEGDITANQKKTIIHLFAETFSVSTDEANDLLISSMYMLRDELEVQKIISKIVKYTDQKPSSAQMESIMEMMSTVASVDGSISKEQLGYLSVAENALKNAIGP